MLVEYNGNTKYPLVIPSGALRSGNSGLHPVGWFPLAQRAIALVLKLLVPQRGGTYEVSLRYATIHLSHCGQRHDSNVYSLVLKLPLVPRMGHSKKIYGK